ncbi:zinc finger protein DZIP1-like isoform X2 [Scyliorhinus canicula]|uniref:zinc finger protein DZIP1-like isoform X2 n=1 Tax=Scyliorhinus canicula TaxID=7830 RepID=UPI0018F673FA|nr:zinc finger protein DZIP1-like isoform X2 [Scyliorhinus canicula]
MWLTGISAVPHNSLSDTTLPSSLTASVRGGQTPLFKFRKRHETINWRRISAIDVDRVANELDFATLQENIMSITFCNLDPEKCPYCQNQLDPTLLKMFKLAQLTIEYLLHSQEYLTSNLQMYEEKLRTSEFGNKELKKELSQLADEMKSQKEECKRRKQIISTQQLMIQSGANNYHKCQYCEKTFMNSFFMQSHIQRRHPNQTDVEKKNYQSDKIQGEIDQLKKQLQKTQSQLEAEKLLYSKTHSQELESRIMKEEETTKSFENWKEEEKKKLNYEMEKMKGMFIQEFKEMTQKNAALEAELLQIKSTSFQLKSSLGALKDARELDIQEESRRYQQEVKDLKNILDKQEQKWTSEISSVFERHDNEKQKIQLDIESLMSSITKNQKESSSYYKKKIKELGRKLHNQHQLITEETEEVKACPIKPPKKILESSLVAATPLRQKSLRLDMKHLPEVSTCNEDLRKVLIKNPKIVKELHKIVEQSLAEKLETLGIKPGVQGISGGQLTRILDTVDSDREEKIKAFPDFYLFRESLSRKVEDKIKGREDSLCHLKNKFIKSTIEKSENNLSKISQPSCSKICKKKVSSPKLSSTTLSSTSSGSGESIGNLSLDTSTSTESSKNEMSETCELEEVCVIEEQKSTENNSAGPKSVEKGLTESIEEELSRRVNARAAKSQQSQKKKVSRELKFIKEKKYDVWEVSSVEDDQCLLPKTEKGRDSSTVAKTGETHSARGINVLSKSSEKATN